MTAASPPVITLLTDFGHSDPYVGVMKGVILARSPATQIVDLTHQVPPQSVLEGAFLLETAWRYFPNGTVFLVVVDPGVGSARKRLAVKAHGMTFVGPDNGLFNTAAARCRQPAWFRIDWRPASLTPTFHGRDLFAPVAARLARPRAKRWSTRCSRSDWRT